MTRGRVVVDLVAPQSPSYRDRGIARHGLAFAEALVERHPDLVDAVLTHPELPPAAGMERLAASGKLLPSPDWPGAGGVYHVTSAFEPEVPVRSLWPREASSGRSRLVVTVYDLIPDVFPDLYLMDPGLRRRWRAGRELVRAADHVFTLSESARDDVIGMLGVAGRRVSVIGAGCDERFEPAEDRGAARQRVRQAIPGLGERFVVYNGAIDPRKNLDRLVEAFARLEGDLRDRVQLVLVCRATPPQRNHHLVHAAMLGAEGRVLMPGWVPDELLVGLYQSAELVVFPSLYEGYGLPVIEARACGAPVIAADNSSLREIVSEEARFDGRDTDSIRSSMARALTDGRFRERLLAESRQPKPTWAAVADRAAATYKRLLAAEMGPDGRRSIVPGWRRRPLVAWVGPDPELETFATALGELVELDRFQSRVTEPPVPGPASLRVVEPWRGGYDAVVVHLNGPASAAALPLLRYPARVLVVLDDDALAATYQAAAEQGHAEPFSQVLRRMYPGLPADLQTIERPTAADAERAGLAMLRDVLDHADRLFVRSTTAAALARLDAGPTARAQIEVLPGAGSSSGGGPDQQRGAAAAIAAWCAPARGPAGAAQPLPARPAAAP
jgi:glycosyltransferase involved in cell wall biosynthesis